MMPNTYLLSMKMRRTMLTTTMMKCRKVKTTATHPIRQARSSIKALRHLLRLLLPSHLLYDHRSLGKAVHKPLSPVQ
jgi:hypothetical protein